MSEKKKTRCGFVGLVLMLLTTANCVFAQRVSKETARSVAETFFSQNMRGDKGQPVYFEDITSETPFHNFYIFSADSGFVLVAADERVKPVLGYSRSHRFVTEDIPENLRWWLEGYEEQIQFAIDNQAPASEKAVRQWNALIAGKMDGMRTRTTVGPLTQTEWGQRGYINGHSGDTMDLYNKQCPYCEEEQRHCLPGCDAIDLAQVMRYWQHPNHPHGSKKYTPNNPQHPEYYPLTMVFDNQSYDWSMMPNYLSAETPQEEINETAKFIYHCATSIGANFGTDGTGSNLGAVTSALIDYFYYKPTASHKQRSSYSDEDWKQMLKDELSASPGRPVCYRGDYDNGEHAHSLVCDGYEEVGDNDYFHFNFGWYGGSWNNTHTPFNDYYSIDPLQKYNVLPYIENQAAVFGIEPDEGSVMATAFPNGGGMVTGAGNYRKGNSCTLTATSNPGFVFMGWYNNALGTILYSRQPEYTFTVTGDRHLYAKFILRNCAITTSCSPTSGGSVEGGGSYMAGSMVTLTATANSGYVFSCWTENGEVVSTQPTYTFQARSDRHLAANFMNLSFAIGDVITNPDGSKGVVFYINPTYTGGCMVALEDISTTCPWGSNVDIKYLRNYTFTKNEFMLTDLEGYANTSVIRDYQSANADYASGKVDYGHGWYVPSAGQLRKLFGALPFIESAITSAGGTTLAENANYWSSTENTASNAWTSAFEMVSKSKTSNFKVRAVHDFSVNNTMCVQVKTNDAVLGNVVGTGFYSAGSQVTVMATPTGDNLFQGWTEAGHLVSLDPSYTFLANANRELVANFAVRGGVGTLVTNLDGSQGILFHLNEDGTQGLMVALEDASEGCQWGPSSDIIIIKDRPINNQRALEDQSGYSNTQLIRLSLGTNNGYAASMVDFGNGWYLPSTGQLRKLYAALPMIEEALARVGGNSISGTYWSSTECSASNASTVGFETVSTSKTTNCKVRAIRNYLPSGDNVVLAAANNDSFGMALVSGSGVFAQNQNVTVRAYPRIGYQFDHWEEDGATVSYDAVYQFPFTRSRSLVAHFVVPGTIGSVITNADGSRGVVFYTDPSGNSLMVALTDASSGCAWGANQDITTLANMSPSQSQNMLSDMNGYANTQIIREWQSNNSNYAAGIVDFANEWYLPSAGEMRKLYAALPLIEKTIVCAGGSLMTGDLYWSSSEQSANNAWSPSFEFSTTVKTTNRRVRSIRSVTPQTIVPVCQTLSFSPGWNWFSSFIEYDENAMADLQGQLDATGATAIIKSQNAFVSNESGSWAGSLNGLDNTQTYMISLDGGVTIALNGMAVVSSNHPITLHPGWNWVGYYFSEPMSLEEFFSGVMLMDGDIIKSQNSFSTYSTSLGWSGNLTTLEPGEGYLFMSAGTTDRVLVFPAR